MPILKHLSGLEILDSRGRPTVLATCELSSGVRASASVPSGASTGAAEAIELRDGDLSRYRGLGCRSAASKISEVLSKELAGQTFETQQSLDEAMIRLDGTVNKSRLGANTLLASSLAWARAVSLEEGIPLYSYFARLTSTSPRLPKLTVNLFSGGKHAGGQIPIQDLLLVPVSAANVAEALSMVVAVFQCAAELMADKYGMRLLRADEGGLAPPFSTVADMIEDALFAVEQAGLTPGLDLALAVDVASSHFFKNGHYLLEGKTLDSPQMIAWLKELVNTYPIVSIEDGLAEEDWKHWPSLCNALAPKSLVLGDDFLCTNPDRIQHAIRSQACNALLLKANQIGTLSEAAYAYTLARTAGWSVVISARSGETEDDWLADLATGWQGDFIKVGSVTQSERLAKYNRLLILESMGLS